MARGMACAALAVVALAAGTGAAWAEPVMLQCGREYQSAKAAGTLGGQDWAAFRTSCANRLKAAAASPAAGTNPVPVAAASPATPPATASTSAPAAAGGGMAAMHARQRTCGAEWRAQKASLVASTPGLTWPRYWSQCNARLKAAR